jgi:hypothetical protein
LTFLKGLLKILSNNKNITKVYQKHLYWDFCHIIILISDNEMQPLKLKNIKSQIWT